MIDAYEKRAAEHGALRDAEARVSRVISRLRLATFIPGATAIIYALARPPAPVVLTAGLVLLAAFAVLVVWHARVEERVAWYGALQLFNLQAIARITRTWSGLPEAPAPPDVDLEQHPYAADLDLFGRASLMQWLGPAATIHGARTLQRWLLEPSPHTDVLTRQAAVVDLAPGAEWREHLGALGRLASGVRAAELDVFLSWAEARPPLSPRAMALLRAAVIAITAAIWILAALHYRGVTDTPFWLIPTTIGIVLSFVTAGVVHGQFTRAGAGEHAFTRYADLFLHATRLPAAGALGPLVARFSAAGLAAPSCMRRLNRILGFASLRAGAGLFHFVVQALTLWDFHVFFALERWRSRVGPHVRDWMHALGELDALSTFAHVKADNPSWALAAIAPAATAFAAQRLGHPLIPDARRVVNDVGIGPPGTLLLITGSNMSGKSTLLRAIGVNAVLAQAGAPVCASSLTMPPLEVQTSIRVIDSLEHGMSYFMSALARLKRIVDRSDENGERRVMYLLDEILQGTNTAERSIAVRGVAGHLLGTSAIGVMTTHDLGIAEEEPLRSAAALAHFTETVDEHGAMTFDYQLRPGLATSRNALRLMELIGIRWARG